MLVRVRRSQISAGSERSGFLRDAAPDRREHLGYTAVGRVLATGGEVEEFRPGDRVLAVTAGSFGDRFINMAEAYGADVTRMDFEWGGPIDPGAIRKGLHGTQVSKR